MSWRALLRSLRVTVEEEEDARWGAFDVDVMLAGVDLLADLALTRV